MIRSVGIFAAIVTSPVAVFLAFGGDSEIQLQSGGFNVPEEILGDHGGRELFAESCGGCHGQYGEGSNHGPPLVHDIYAPVFLKDADIRTAVIQGAVARNWPFGDMPPIESLSNREIESVVEFVRLVQLANNIE